MYLLEHVMTDNTELLELLDQLDPRIITLANQCSQLTAALALAVSTLNELVSEPIDIDGWAIKCIDDHNAIITETLGQITSMLAPDRCCDTPRVDINGGCVSCGDPCL